MGGVSQPSDGNGGLYVRGGSNDQNLILLNGTPLQAPNHIFGIFSVFNSDIVDQMRFIKSGMPAEYGSRLSSVVDINTTTSIPDKLQVDGSIGLILSRISAKVPITRKLMVYGSVRASYISSTVLPLMRIAHVDTAFTNNRYDFKDINTGISWRMNEKSKLSAHFYQGTDDIQVGKFKKSKGFNENNTNWGNTLASIQFNHIFSENLSTNHLLSFSRFRLESSLNILESQNLLQTNKKNIRYHADFVQIHQKHLFKYGLQCEYTATTPKKLQTDSMLPLQPEKQYSIYRNLLNSVYFRDEWTSDRWQINWGLRVNYYLAFTTQDCTGQQSEENYHYRINKTYFNPEPRLFIRYLTNEHSALKASVSRVNQYINQIAVFSVGIPFDIQIPATQTIKPQASWQYAGGYFVNLWNNKIETSAEIYYKTMENQLEFNNSISNSIFNNIADNQLYQGKGQAYGAEISIRLNGERLNGWLAYNLGWTKRQFDQINKGQTYYASNDRRHDLSAVLMYKVSNRWDFSALFVFASGNRLNLPVSWYIINGNTIWEYNKYNSFQMPAYHRLDLSANCHLKPIHGIRSEINISFYNIYNRANPYQVFFSTKTVGNSYNYTIKMAYLLPIIPSVSWTFHI